MLIGFLYPTLMEIIVLSDRHAQRFFLQSINETNIFQASLMFFDRFTRDMNIATRHDHYPKVSAGYFYDPPQNYTLNQGKIKYLPPAFIVEDE